MTLERDSSTYDAVDRSAEEEHEGVVGSSPSDPTAPDPDLSTRIINEQTTYVDNEVHRTATEQAQVIVRSKEDLAWLRLRNARRTVYFIVHVISIFIMIRFFLLLAGANPENAFASFIYGLTGIFMAPFNTLFGSGAQPIYGVPVINGSALFAISMYYLFAWIGVRIAHIVVRRHTLNKVERKPLPPVQR